MAITKVTSSVLDVDIPSFKTFGTSSIMVGDTTTGTIDAANYNTGLGVDVFAALTSGDNNVAVGFNALTALTTGLQNTAIGTNTLQTLTTASYNTAVGQSALLANTTGATNTAMGASSMVANTTGYDNTAVGKNAMLTSTTAITSSAFGVDALYKLTTGSGGTNEGFGYRAGRSITTGYANSVFGSYAMDNSTATGYGNTVIGHGAARALSGAFGCTLVGSGAGAAFTTGVANTTLGYGAGNNQTTGAANTFIGYNARGSATSTSYAITMGYDTVSAGDYFTTLGTGSGANRVYNQFSANASWTRASDIRYKDEINNNTDCGLAFINDLRPVTFKFKANADIDSSLPDYDEEATERLYDKKMYGLIAQEVKTALDNHNITDFAGWDEGENGVQGISQEMFVHPLIKAVQELSAKNDALEARIEALEN